jgi:hypothetical protein
MGPGDAHIIIYGYVPSKVLCILAFALFGIALIAHVYQAVHYRTWYFLSFTLGIAMELAGYVPRYLSGTRDPYRVSYFVVQYFFIVCAPVALTAAMYACLYKMARWASMATSLPQRSIWTRPKWILWTFITADVVTTVLQVAGAALIGVAESNGKDSATPNNILLAGLVVQTFSFLMYFVVFGSFMRNTSRESSSQIPRNVWQYSFALLAASVLILLRTCFRLAETAQGVFGYLSSHEAFFGALEFAPVVLAVLILVIWHPGCLVPLEMDVAGIRFEGIGKDHQTTDDGV